jgi:hypothetical protein
MKIVEFIFFASLWKFATGYFNPKRSAISFGDFRLKKLLHFGEKSSFTESWGEPIIVVDIGSTW